MVSHIEGSAKILLKPGVFLNPAQVFNRDLSILVASTYLSSQVAGTGFSILEPLAATGLRSIRYSKELSNFPLKRIVANDIDPEAVAQIKQNFLDNEVNGEVWHKDALDAMYSTRGTWDIVDVDPYGSVASFLDASVQSVKNGGLLCLTSTDMITLCGNNPDTCFYKYQSIPTKSKFCHEFALRIILYQLSATANKYQLAIVPLISLSVDFYVRVFVKVISSAATAKLSIFNTSQVFQCSKCPAFYLHKFGRNNLKRMVGNFFEGYSQCPHCEAPFLVQGPIYSGPLHDCEFAKKVMELADTKEFKTKDKVKGILNTIISEIQEPLSWNMGALCKFFKTPAISQKNLRSAVKCIGKKISQSHTGPIHYKTDATVDEIFQIFRQWKKEKTGDKYLNNIEETSPAYKILKKEENGVKIDFDLDYNEDEKNFLKNLRFPANEKNWGPGSRPKKEETKHED